MFLVHLGRAFRRVLSRLQRTVLLAQGSASKLTALIRVLPSSSKKAFAP